MPLLTNPDQTFPYIPKACRQQIKDGKLKRDDAPTYQLRALTEKQQFEMARLKPGALKGQLESTTLEDAETDRSIVRQVVQWGLRGMERVTCPSGIVTFEEVAHSGLLLGEPCDTVVSDTILRQHPTTFQLELMQAISTGDTLSYDDLGN